MQFSFIYLFLVTPTAMKDYHKATKLREEIANHLITLWGKVSNNNSSPLIRDASKTELDWLKECLDGVKIYRGTESEGRQYYNIAEILSPDQTNKMYVRMLFQGEQSI